MRRRVRIQPYVPRDLQQKVRAWAAAQNLTESAVTEAALTAYLDDGRTDEDIIARRLDLVSQAVARLQSDVDVLADAFGGYVRRLFLVALTKAGPDQDRHADEAYQTFLRAILDDSGVAGRFIGDVRRARTRAIARPTGAPHAGGR